MGNTRDINKYQQKKLKTKKKGDLGSKHEKNKGIGLGTFI